MIETYFLVFSLGFNPPSRPTLKIAKTMFTSYFYCKRQDRDVGVFVKNN